MNSGDGPPSTPGSGPSSDTGGDTAPNDADAPGEDGTADPATSAGDDATDSSSSDPDARSEDPPVDQSPADEESDVHDTPASQSSEDPSTTAEVSVDDRSSVEPSTGNGASPGDEPSAGDEPSLAGASPLAKLRRAEQGPWWLAREVLLNVGAVVAVGLLLFAVSGVWPPMVAVESGSMEPHMQKGDLVFVTAPGRWAPGPADQHAGVVTLEQARDVDYRTFGSYGSVVVYDNPSRPGPPVIHRAHFWVEEGENWYPRANPDYVFADSCAELESCPADHAGYITKGDANSHYDQVNGISGPVRPAWVTGIARIRIPFFGWIRLLLSAAAPPAVPVDPVAAATVGEALASGTAPPDADATVHQSSGVVRPSIAAAPSAAPAGPHAHLDPGAVHPANEPTAATPHDPTVTAPAGGLVA